MFLLIYSSSLLASFFLFSHCLIYFFIIIIYACNILNFDLLFLFLSTSFKYFPFLLCFFLLFFFLQQFFQPTSELFNFIIFYTHKLLTYDFCSKSSIHKFQWLLRIFLVFIKISDYYLCSCRIQSVNEFVFIVDGTKKK